MSRSNVQKLHFPRSISGQFERSDFFNTIGRKRLVVRGGFQPKRLLTEPNDALDEVGRLQPQHRHHAEVAVV